MIDYTHIAAFFAGLTVCFIAMKYFYTNILKAHRITKAGLERKEKHLKNWEQFLEDWQKWFGIVYKGEKKKNDGKM